ncbi:MAG: hypothetical protein J6J23_05720 [Clostridia bacterium]|nr:hypothetical protein [Clostridia bacterium]
MTKREHKISKRLYEHYDYLLKNDFEIVAVFVQGSQNYNLDVYDEDYRSDIDTKAIVLPSFEDFVKGKSPISTTIVLDNDEHIDVKDIRVMFDVMQKSNINYLEILFTKFKMINQKYEKLLKPIFDNNEAIAFSDKKQLINCIVGMEKQKLCALKHPYPSILDKIEKFGYDPKQLHHIIRLNYFLKKILDGQTFGSSLDEKDRRDYLIAVKKGIYSLAEAENLAKEFDIETTKLKNIALKKNAFERNEVAEKIFGDVQYEILKTWFREQLLING